MVKKILKTITNNLLFKLLALFFAFALWLAVYNIDDPNQSKNFTVSVTMQNTSSLTDNNKCFEVMDGTGIVTFRVTAKRSIMEKLNNSDFTAIADFNEITANEDQTEGSVPIEISATTYYASSIKIGGLTKYLRVSIDDLQKKQFVITAKAHGTVADGFALGDVSVSNPNVIQVSGPAGIIANISSVVATIDVSGMSVDITDKVVPKFLDKNGNEVDTTKLQKSNDTVTISARILSTKEVPIHLTTSGNPATDYSVIDIKSDVEKVTIKGTSAVLNPITAIEVPAEVLNVDGANRDINTVIDISEYLPEGVSLVDREQSTVTVSISIKAYRTQSFNITSNNINIIGLDSDYEVIFPQNNIGVRISGMDDDLAKLDAGTIKGSIDVTTLGEGSHTVEIKLDLDTQLYQTVEATTSISVQKKSEVTNNTNGDDTNGTDTTPAGGNTTGNGDTSGTSGASGTGTSGTGTGSGQGGNGQSGSSEGGGTSQTGGGTSEGSSTAQ